MSARREPDRADLETDDEQEKGGKVAPDSRLYSRPMDFSLTADQREIQALARQFAEAEIAPQAGAWDRDHTFPSAVFAKLGELGLMGVCVPEQLGGAGADFLSYTLVLEELSRADAGVGVTVAVHTGAVTLPIVAFGTEEQRQRFVPELAAGRRLGAFALTEAESGSDAGALRSSAVADGEGWTITGTKQWITNGSYAGTFLVFVRTDPSTDGTRGISAFLLDGDDVEVTREEEKLGLHSSSTADIRIEAAFVGRDRLLHDENRGFAVAMATLDGGRIGIAAQAVGIAQAAYDVARGYALERRQFGQPDRRFPGDPVQARRHGDRDRGSPLAHLPGRLAQAAGPSSHRRRRPGEAVRVVGRTEADRRGDPGARRVWLHEGIPGRALLP